MRTADSRSHAVVIVLGDSGRSPRMQFHAQSLAGLREVDRVTLVGYAGEACNKAITENDKIRDCRLDASGFKCVEFLRSISSLLHAVLKGVLLVISLVRSLFSVSGSCTTESGKTYSSIPISFIIIQNPPATPVILACYIYQALVYLYAFFTLSSISAQSFSICIDWHNLGFTLYYDRYERSHILVRICYYLEYLLARLSDRNLCVSAAMQKWLLTNYGIESTVFYDRPPKSVFQKFISDDATKDSSSDSEDSCNVDCFGCVPLHVRHDLLRRLKLTDATHFPALVDPPNGNSATSTSFPPSSDHHFNINMTDMTEVTLQTYRHRTTGDVHIRQDRAVILLSSTSWTPDEDFSLLTRALINLDKSIVKRRGSESPRKTKPSSSHSQSHCSNMQTRVVVVITGKGPLKEKFMTEWNESQEAGKDTRLTYVSLVTVWLEVEDYPLMVGCADMGICLHTSSSGVDLPMKVLDMFGSAVPVCAVSFPALPELVQNGSNGIIFRTSSELSAHLFRLFCDFPRDLNSIKDLQRMKRQTLKIGCWEDNWAAVVRPVVLKCLVRKAAPRHVSVLRWTAYVLLAGLVCWHAGGLVCGRQDALSG